ncbi:MAG TPA: sigma-54-dependent Fis family transcriptional regulator [Spirochaetia bacterium]|nr:sigma-54-dependent Fis family transcriptional regulator [Spirochaetia bacterium]
MDKLPVEELITLLDSTHDAIIATDAAGRITVFNAAAERLIGLKAATVLGRPAVEVIPNTRLNVVLATGEPELNRPQVLGHTTIITNRVPVRDSGGRLTGAVAVFRDITELESVAQELTAVKKIKTLLEAVINATQDAISVVDENGLGILINPAYTRLTGLTAADVLGKPATVDIAEGESVHLKVLASGQPVSSARMRVGPARKDVLVDVAPILVDGVVKGSVGVIHDVSQIIELSHELEKARRLIRQLEARYTFEDITGSAPEMAAAVDMARLAASTRATVLLRGESGTGKELFAHAIHNASTRHSRPFIRVNCAALAESILESELFGYEAGAFTGALRGGRKGLFQEADGGTIFLDEIGELGTSTQAKLLRVLQEREILKVGATSPVPVDVRVIAATNAHLEELLSGGRFREDLYYRLNVIAITIPPLRQRKEDIPQLVARLLPKINQDYGRNVQKISREALDILMRQNWPGNVRELENILGRAIINMRYSEIEIGAGHLPMITRADWAGPVGQGVAEAPLAVVIGRVERDAIIQALAKSGNNKTLAARHLGISVRNLYYKMVKHSLLPGTGREDMEPGTNT